MTVAPPDTLTDRELNRAVLARQMLLERVEARERRSGGAGVPEALERMAGLQAQYAPSMYVGLWSRMAGLARADLTGALERREVVQGTLLRATIHLVSAADYWPFALAVREARRKWWRRAVGKAFDEDEVQAAADRVRARLAGGGGPIRRAELEAVVGKALVNGVGLWVDLVRVPPSGTWERRRADLYDTAENWVGPAPDLTTEAATDHLVRRYLGGFGPATVAEVADWAGLTTRDVAAALERLGAGGRLRQFRAEDGQTLHDLVAAPLLPAGATAPPRFLPTWDALLLVHARRTQVLAEEHRPRIFNTKMPQSVGTFLVDGTVAGTWRHRSAAGERVEIEPFGTLPKAARREVEEEADRLWAFYA